MRPYTLAVIDGGAKLQRLFIHSCVEGNVLFLGKVNGAVLSNSPTDLLNQLELKFDIFIYFIDYVMYFLSSVVDKAVVSFRHAKQKFLVSHTSKKICFFFSR